LEEKCEREGNERGKGKGREGAGGQPDPTFSLVYATQLLVYGTYAEDGGVGAVVKVRGARGGSAPLLRLWPPCFDLGPLLESEPSTNWC